MNPSSIMVGVLTRRGETSRGEGSSVKTEAEIEAAANYQTSKLKLSEFQKKHSSADTLILDF